MQTFLDYYGNQVEFTVGNVSNELAAKHVWVICRYKNDWLLTRHKVRGLEFPGGKVEKDETPREAAYREVMEETGGRIKSIQLIGQYRVFLEEIIMKNVYVAEIESIELENNYFETNGPKLIKAIPDDVKTNEEYSFIMKDDCLQLSLQFLTKKKF